MFKAALFDLDGTLLDTLGSIAMYLNSVLDEYKIKKITKEQARMFVGDGAKQLVRLALENDNIKPDENPELFHEITEVYVRRYNNDPYPMTEPYPGIQEAVRQIKARGIKLAVISNKPNDTVVQLTEHFFPDMFDCIYGARESVKLKPSPEAPLAICEKLGVLPCETAYFGDTAVDMKTGAALGAGLTVGVLWGFRDREELVAGGADLLIKSAEEISNIIE